VTNNEKRPGLGEVIYSVDDDSASAEKSRKQEEVTEAAVESFPASDPPSFSGATADPDGESAGGAVSEPER
jgi:hypothetical protein